MSSREKNCPRGLSPAARRWWGVLVAEYHIDDAPGALLLETALVAWDRMQEARRTLAKEGTVLRDRFGQAKPHPACAVERDSRMGFLSALKALNLDVEPLKGIGRPGAGLGISSEQIGKWRRDHAE
jgi:phage terminase small subunit